MMMNNTYTKSIPIGRWSLIAITIIWFLLLILVPVGGLIQKLLASPVAETLQGLTTKAAVNAFLLTIKVTVITILINTVMGVLMARVLVKQNFKGRLLIEGLIDLPFAISPVVAGFMIVILFGPYGWLGGWLEGMGVKVVYSVPGIILATIFVTLPFVAKEVIPVYRQFGQQSEETAQVMGASQWQTFWWITLPSIKWGVIYGVTLALARSLGEFGAVLVVSGNIIGQTQTATLYIHQQFTDFDYSGAYAASLVIAMVAFTILIVIQTITNRHREA
ncbi:MAG: sulfate ABC transporter permease subunit [Lentisphaeria bacterium]|nr:sulfate ABC transporter permease subunit [Candidatus Neomarinimicrobiota bacterium]MCF7842318.1 sulfate ABC transporter permease subunit [Lentisphaeria bacterium]